MAWVWLPATPTYREVFEAHGTRGSLEFRFSNPYLDRAASLVIKGEGGAVRHPAGNESPFTRELKAFHRAITSGRPISDGAGAAQDTAFLQDMVAALARRDGLAEGTRIVTDAGPLVADGSDRYVITAAGSSPGLEGRQRIAPPSSEMPVVVYLGEDTGETELLDALADGSIDAVARGEIGNLEAARANGDGGTFAVTALDPEVELGGWTLPATEPALIACLDEKLDYLTDHRTIGYAEWVADPDVFLRRARSWTP